jgi:hypothetical protein
MIGMVTTTLAAIRPPQSILAYPEAQERNRQGLGLWPESHREHEVVP